jgi:hypothetical protein
VELAQLKAETEPKTKKPKKNKKKSEKWSLDRNPVPALLSGINI